MRISDWSSDVCSSDLVEQVFGGTHLEFARRLDVELFDDAVVDEHRIALAARAEAETRSVHLQPDGLRELAVAVGEHRHLAFSLVGLAPRAHDEGDRKSTRLNSSH